MAVNVETKAASGQSAVAVPAAADLESFAAKQAACMAACTAFEPPSLLVETDVPVD